MLCRLGLVADRGANMLEYVGLTIVVAGVAVALAMTTVPSDIQASFADGVCRIVNPGDPDCTKANETTASPGRDGTEAPATGPTSAPGTGPTDSPGTGPGSDDPTRQYDAAKKAADEATKAEADAEKQWGNLDKELLDLVAELVGFNSAKDCFTKGDVGACLETLLTAIPWGKLFKAAKMVPKIWKLFRRWKKLRDKLTKARKARKAAGDKLKKAEEACEIANGPGNSFARGTPVLMADGSPLPIEAVRVGDRVFAADPATGAAQARTVTALVAGTGTKQLVDVSVDLDGLPGGQSATITATAGHRFWVADAGLWIEAGDLVRGDQLQAADGSARTVTGLRKRTEYRHVHNLSVDGPRTYQVGAGQTSVLVHNCAVGFAPEAVSDAFQGMNKGGGHAMRHLIDDGIIPNKGSVAEKAKIFEQKVAPVLTKPDKAFDWKIGDTPSRAFAGRVDGKVVVVFVAKSGPYQGKVISSVVPNAKNLAKWGLL